MKQCCDRPVAEAAKPVAMAHEFRAADPDRDAEEEDEDAESGRRMALRKKSVVSCEVMSENPIADDTAEKTAETVATTMNSRLKSDEPERRRVVRMRKVSAPSDASTIAEPAASPAGPDRNCSCASTSPGKTARDKRRATARRTLTIVDFK